MKGVKILRDQRSNTKERLPAHLQRWQLRVSTGMLNLANDKRERKFRTFRGTEAEADAALRAFISELENGLQLDSKLTVAQFADDWLAEKERDKLAGKTLTRYESISRCYIKPTLGRVVLAELSLADVKRALHEWRMSPRKGRRKDIPATSESTSRRKDRRKDILATSESTIHHVFMTLSNLCESAVIDRKMKENPCQFLKRSQRPRRTTPAIAAADANTALTMLDALLETEVGPITEFASYTGLRLGEALGLPWGNVDLDSGSLVVMQVCEQRSDRAGKRFARIRAYPKTRTSVRDVWLPPQAIALLRRCKAEYNARLLAAGLKASPEHLVFPNPHLGARRGQAWDPTIPWVPDEFSSAYRWRVTRTGLPYISFKALGRATYSTLMASAGVPVQVIQRLLGHSSMTTTMKHYVRILDDAKAQAAKRFGESLEAARRRRSS